MFKKQIVEIDCYRDLIQLAEAEGFIETEEVWPLTETWADLECAAMEYLESVGVVAIYNEEI